MAHLIKVIAVFLLLVMMPLVNQVHAIVDGHLSFDAGNVAYYKRDYITAFKHWSAMARQNDVRSQFGLGILYDEGRGVVRDRKLSLFWFRESARSGFSDAMVQLGFIYATGRKDVATDFIKAYAWFKIAQHHGNNGGEKALGQLKQSMTFDELDEAENLVQTMSIEVVTQTP